MGHCTTAQSAHRARTRPGDGMCVVTVTPPGKRVHSFRFLAAAVGA
ncbi:hypothetical protein ACLF6K_08140 [Streptomyces xanthophaeus]